MKKQKAELKKQLTKMEKGYSILRLFSIGGRKKKE